MPVSEEAINQANQNPSTIIVEETEPQAGASARPKGGRKGKTVQVRTDNKSTNENEPEAVDNEVDEEADSNSDFDSGNKKYNFCTLAKLLEPVLKLTSCSYYSWSAHIKSFLRSVPHTMKHLEGAYDKKHPKWSCTLDDALTNALHGTIDTTGKHNVNYLILDIIREYLTFHQVWRRIENGLTNKATKMPHRLALISQLGNIKMFHSDARKLIQEIQSIQTESSLLGKPFADDTLFSALQKCMICHPVYKETVVTIHQIDFNTLALALSTRQTAVESIPAQKINPCQASTRIAGSNDQDKQAKEAEMSNDDTNAKEAWCSLTPNWQKPLDPREAAHWILDLGASHHMVNNYSMLVHPRTCQKCVITTGNEVLEATAIGDISVSTDYGDIPLQNVLYVKNLKVNLLSTNSLMDEGAQVILDTTSRQIYLANGMILKVAKNREQGLLEFQGDTWQESAMITSTPLLDSVDEEFEQSKSELKISKQQLWHEHFGHPGRDKSKAITDKLKGKPIVELDPDIALTCEQCIQSKSTGTWMGQGSDERATRPLDLIHINLFIDSSHVTEYMCTLVLVDDHSKYMCIQPLLRKSHTFTQLKKIVTFLKTQTGRELKAIRSDQGTEWRNNEALEWVYNKGVQWQTTVGYNSRQNRRVERMNRNLGEKMWTLLMQRRLPKRFWPYTIRAAAFKINLTPSIDNEFLYQAMFGKSPERFMGLLRVFGCLAWVSWDRMRRKQEEPKSYEEEHRNRRIGQNEGLWQSSSRSVVERLYDRFHPNQYKRDLTAKPTGICSIMIIRQILQEPVRGHWFHRSHNKTEVENIGFTTLMKQGPTQQ
ncbi:related to retrotransposon protein [Ustilago bromivora]|uniref:Related to retrotransposon protein n=1 Tax=Ustilago bromivora TaxID=307758 RepID=A0A1K0H454_9BASI|nr:related to retrotransposon protein [Ustilago bromivora]